MDSGILIAIAAVSLGGILLVVWLLKSYSQPAPFLGFPVTALGPKARRILILSSVLGLYLEMLLIRWISSEIRIFAYFKNFVLVACFLGFGLGCYLCRRAISVPAFVIPLAFVTALISLPWPSLRRLITILPNLLGETSETIVWGVGFTSFSVAAFTDLLLATFVMLPVFALIAITFIPIGQIVGDHLETSANGIAAYSINIIGSLLGIALYAILSFLSQPPITWMIIATLLATLLFWNAPRARVTVAGVLLACVLLIAVGVKLPGRTYWSPYQQLNLRPVADSKGNLVSLELMTNSSWYQRIVNVSPRFVRAHPDLFQSVPLALSTYNLAYRFYPNPPSVLVLGSGMGNDVAAALRNGAGHVTAVDIDPLIVELGRTLHPERPYASPRVTTVVDDGRSYLQNTQRHFDMIVLAALDSHTMASHFSNIRIDNYIYTREAFEAAKRLLTPDGVVVVRFWVQRPWVAGRLHELLISVFGFEPLSLRSAIDGYAATGDSFFVTGSRQQIDRALSDPAFAAYVRANPIRRMEPAIVPTDDWPYFYQREPGLPTSVVAISLLLIIVSVIAVNRIGLRLHSVHAEFFFLGAGFLLLEAQIISRMALLFGTTWIVNSLVIAVLMLLIVAANGIAAIAPRLRYETGYIGILLSIAMCYAVPLQVFFFRSFAVKAIVATLFLCLPVFFAGIVFVKRFSAAGFDASAIGSNLLGSLAGGLVESASLWLGLRSLLLIAAVFYAAAWVASRREAVIATAAAPGIPAS